MLPYRCKLTLFVSVDKKDSPIERRIFAKGWSRVLPIEILHKQITLPETYREPHSYYGKVKEQKLISAPHKTIALLYGSSQIVSDKVQRCRS